MTRKLTRHRDWIDIPNEKHAPHEFGSWFIFLPGSEEHEMMNSKSFIDFGREMGLRILYKWTCHK